MDRILRLLTRAHSAFFAGTGRANLREEKDERTIHGERSPRALLISEVKYYGADNSNSDRCSG